MSKPVSFSHEELVILRHAMRIAGEDGSIYSNEDDEDKVDRLVEKIDNALRPATGASHEQD